MVIALICAHNGLFDPDSYVLFLSWFFSNVCYSQNEYVLYYYSNLSVPTGRFQNRSHLVGDIFRNDGSLLLQDVQKADEGIYTCEIRLKNENMVLKKPVELLVLPEDSKGMGYLTQRGTRGEQIACGREMGTDQLPVFRLSTHLRTSLQDYSGNY